MNNVEAASVPRHGVGHVLIEIVYFLILLVTVSSWAIVGFLVWIPLLVRTTGVLAGAVLYATLFRDPDRVVRAERGLHAAVGFYSRGFKHFIDFYRQRHAEEHPEALLSDVKWKELAIECAWVVGMWAIFYLLFHPLFARVFS